VLVRMFMSAVDPDDLPRIREMFEEDIRPVLSRQPGCESVELVVSTQRNAGGMVEGAAISRWRSVDDLEAALSQHDVQDSILRIRDLLRQEPVTKTYEVLG